MSLFVVRLGFLAPRKCLCSQTAEEKRTRACQRTRAAIVCVAITCFAHSSPHLLRKSPARAKAVARVRSARFRPRRQCSSQTSGRRRGARDIPGLRGRPAFRLSFQVYGCSLHKLHQRSNAGVSETSLRRPTRTPRGQHGSLLRYDLPATATLTPTSAIVFKRERQRSVSKPYSQSQAYSSSA